MLKTCLTAFGNVFSGILNNWKFFQFFEIFLQVSTLQGKLVIFFNQKNYLGACWKLVWTLLGKILVILKIKVFQFFLSFSKFRPSRVHWALFFREKPQNKFKTCLDTFGNVFGYLEFWEVFAFLWNFSTSLPSRVHWPKNFDKITSNLDWTLLVTFLDTFEISKCFRLFFELFQVSTLQGKLVIFLPKKLPRSMLKTCLNIFGKDFGHFEKKSFSIFLKFFQVSTLQGALGTFFSRNTSKQVQNLFGYFWKRVWVSWILGSFCISLKFFNFSTLQGALAKKFRKNHIKTCLDNLGNVFGHFWKFEFFSISVELFWVSRVHWAESFSVETIKQNMLKQCFWERSWRILKVSKFFHLFVFFASFDHPGCTGQKFLPKNYLEACWKHVWTLLGTFLGILKNWKFFQFFEVFPSVDPTGCIRHFFPRKLPENKFKTCVETFKIVFGHFWEFNFFRFFLPSFTNFDLQVALGKKNSKKLPQASLDTFDNVFRDFEFLKSFRFLWIFLSLQGSLGRAFFRRNNQAKHAQTMFLGTFLEKFESFAVFPLFCIFCEFRPPRVHWAKIFFQKKYLEACWKHVWLLLGTFFQAFWTIGSFSSFLNFFQVRPSRVHWPKKFDKITSNLVWTLLVTFLDTFEISKWFRFFFELFQVSILQGKLVVFLTKKTTSEHVENLFEHFWEWFWSFWKKKFFNFS